MINIAFVAKPSSVNNLFITSSTLMQLPIYQVDAFTDKLFGGNPAAVVPLKIWLSDELMQKIAFENNLSETAFFCTKQNGLRYSLVYANGRSESLRSRNSGNFFRYFQCFEISK